MQLNQIFEEVESQLTATNWSIGTNVPPLTINGQPFWNAETKKVNILTKVSKWFGLYVKTKLLEIDPDIFFDTLKRSKKEVKIIDGIVDKYLNSIKKAEQFGQTALAEKMKDEIEVVRKEALAVVNGVKEYLTEQQVEKLMKKSSKNIEIDNIKNFVRHLPENLIGKVEKLKKDNVFDSYVVMHYDPKKENTELTKKEKEKKRDPILFGLIKGSRNLYFIGDWVDEYCDLTLKEAVNIIEEKSKSLLTR